jgi:hypothetical protein
VWRVACGVWVCSRGGGCDTQDEDEDEDEDEEKQLGERARRGDDARRIDAPTRRPPRRPTRPPLRCRAPHTEQRPYGETPRQGLHGTGSVRAC